MNLRTQSPVFVRPSWQPIGPRLSRVSPGAARASRVVADDRFQRWLAEVLALPWLRVDSQTFDPPALVFGIGCASGPLRVAVESGAIPAAMQAALGLADQQLACDVATALLEPWLECLHPIVEGCRILEITRATGPVAGLVLQAQGLRLLVCEADERFAVHAERLLQAVPVVLAGWPSGLQLRARLRLMVRHWTVAFISSLATGDTVLLDKGGEGQRLIVGTGYSMQVDTELSIEQETVSAVGEPRLGPDEPGGDHHAAAAQLQDLELPVSFEIDTARVSLSELAAIRPGYVVELDAPLARATVRLVCQGQTIGTGQLVAVGEQFGVRIVHMGSSHAGSSHGTVARS